MPPRNYPSFKTLGRGSNGAVLKDDPKSPVVYKWTVDPVEVYVWLVVTHSQQYQHRHHLPGFPRVEDVRIGDREAVIIREDALPLKGRTDLLQGTIRDALQSSARWETAARLTGNRALLQRARKRRWLALNSVPTLRPLARTLAEIGSRAALPIDVRAGNLGRSRRMLSGGTGRGARIMLLDPGRTALESDLVSHGEAMRKCPNEKALSSAVANLLGHAPSYSACGIASAKQLQAVMQQHGWRAAEIDGTAGFHTEDGRILLRKGDEWSLLHEMVHAAGVVDASMAPWLTEGITEATAQEVSKARGWAHTPTYPDEVAFVRGKLARVLKTDVLTLGKNVVADPKGAGWRVSVGLSRALGGTADSWYQYVGPRSADWRTLDRRIVTATKRGAT